MKKRTSFIVLVSVLLIGVAAADDVLPPSWPCGTNASALAQDLCRLLHVQVLSQEAIYGLREMPLMTNIAVLARIDPLDTDMQDLLVASSVFSALNLRRFSRADISVLSNQIDAIREQWASLDPGQDPLARTSLRERLAALEFILPSARAQVMLTENLEALAQAKSSAKALVFRLAGFDPLIRSVEPSTIDLLVREATPVCDNLLPRAKPVPFSQYWSPDEYAWRDVALNNAHQAKVLIFLNRNEPLVYMILLTGGLWIGPCGAGATPWAFSFGPNPPEALCDALEMLVNHGGEGGSATEGIQDHGTEAIPQISPQ